MEEDSQSRRTSISRIDKGAMKRVLKVKDLFAVGYGDLGSSIYYALGITAFFALGATPLALLIAGVVFTCTGLTYAEMSSVVFEAGGSASYSRRAFNDLISFIAGWALLLDYIVTIAISSFAVGPYLKMFFPFLSSALANSIFAVCLIFGLTTLNIIGVRHSTRLSVVLTILAIVTQLIIILMGAIFLVDLPTVIEHMKIGHGNTIWSPSWTSFWKGVAMAMVAYTGIESMAQLSSEAKHPSKTVPKAIIWAIGTLLLLYIGISVVSLSAMTPQELSSEYIDDPIAGIVRKIPYIGSYLVHWVGLIGAIILVVASNAGLIGASRLSFNLGENYQLPQIFYILSKKNKTPIVSLLVFATFASIIIIWSRGRLEFLADLYNFGAMLAFFSAHLALIMHRIRYSDVHRPFKIPFNIPFKGKKIPISAIIGAIATLSVWVLVLFTKPEGRNLGVFWLILGVVMYLYYRKHHRISALGNLDVQKVKINEYKNLNIQNILVPTRGGIETETVQIACQIAKSQGGRVTAVNIIEVPFSFPLHSHVFKKPQDADAVLKRAEAIAGEYGVSIALKQIRARSVTETLLELVEREGYDLLIIGAPPVSGKKHSTNLGQVTERILQEATCRVWVCRGIQDISELKIAPNQNQGSELLSK